MIKLMRLTVQKIAVLLKLQELGLAPEGEPAVQVYQLDPSDTIRRAVYAIQDESAETRRFTPGQLVKELEELLTQVQPSGDASLLIDRMVEILQEPFVINRMTADALLALRRAILTPSEVGELRSSLAKGEGRCGCGKKFQHGEMVTFYNNGEWNGRLLYCTQCSPPSYQACSHEGCSGMVRFKMPHVQCKEHAGKKKDQIAQPVEQVRVAPAVRWDPEGFGLVPLDDFPQNVVQIREGAPPAPAAQAERRWMENILRRVEGGDAPR